MKLFLLILLFFLIFLSDFTRYRIAAFPIVFLCHVPLVERDRKVYAAAPFSFFIRKESRWQGIQQITG
jgi:hypothetical protein